MIELELLSKPVSDNILSKMIAKKGMSIARRADSKYHKLMNIPPVTLRKSVL